VKRIAVAVVAVAAAGALAGWAVASLPLFSPPSQITEYGYVQSITPKGNAYVLRFDPALWLEGETANAAAVVAGEIKPGESVPNDYFILNPDHQLLTYKLPANAHVTVLVYLKTTKVSVAYLAKLLKGKSGCGTKFELTPPCRNGFWLRYSIDTVKALDQQYQP
jgi:hypothetical protein